MADWNNSETIYRTLDASYIRNQLKVFYQLYEKELIYRDLKPVYWSPSSKTALAEAELEYNPNFESPSLTLRLHVPKITQAIEQIATGRKVYALIWTTTPWSLAANQAVCFSPELKYSIVKLVARPENELYIVATSLIQDIAVQVEKTISSIDGNDLNGTYYSHPILTDQLLPMLPAGHVQANKGTGLVHTAPAHGPDDFLVSLAHNISIVS